MGSAGGIGDARPGVRERVRAHYAAAAARASHDTGCGCDGCGGGAGAPDFTDPPGRSLYGEPGPDGAPETALLASLGCGNPTAVADLREGEVVLDLGSGAGLDVVLSARRVGPAGKAYGLDMTDEMLDLARENARAAGVENVEFIEGYIEDVPLPGASVDVVISNCVVNLSVDKERVFREMHRVLRPGGRLVIADMVADDGLSAEARAERGSYEGCIAGTLSFAEYRAGLRAAGFEDVEIRATHDAADGIHAAIVRAVKPARPLTRARSIR